MYAFLFHLVISIDLCLCPPFIIIVSHVPNQALYMFCPVCVHVCVLPYLLFAVTLQSRCYNITILWMRKLNLSCHFPKNTWQVCARAQLFEGRVHDSLFSVVPSIVFCVYYVFNNFFCCLLLQTQKILCQTQNMKNTWCQRIKSRWVSWALDWGTSSSQAEPGEHWGVLLW